MICVVHLESFFKQQKNIPTSFKPRILLSLSIGIWDSPGQGLAMRVLSIARDIARYRPMAVLLQEVIPPALESLGGRRE